MDLVMDIELLTDAYQAADGLDREGTEWPPHPSRVFCALVASMRADADADVLRWLESLPAPMVMAAPQAALRRRSSWVVTNKRDSKGGSLSHPARTNAFRTLTSVAPTSARVRMVWTGVEPSASRVQMLDELARRVPYLGRSTGLALLAASAAHEGEAPTDGMSLVAHHPSPLDQSDMTLRVPYGGYLDQLVALHATGRPAWEASRGVGYRRADREAVIPVEVPRSAYTDLVTLQFTGVRPDGRLAPLFTEALRRAVLARCADPLPSALHGHGADGRPHVAFLALPFVGAAHADGHLLGLAVAVPELPADERRAILRGILSNRRDDGSVPLTVPHIGAVDLRYEPGLVRPWGARPERWRRGSRMWTTATPVVLDRYPKRGGEEREVRRSCRVIGLPDPSEVVVSNEPLSPGGVRLRPKDLPQQVQGRPYRHVSLRFDKPVAGPLLLGAGRYLGIGLFAPDLTDRDVA